MKEEEKRARWGAGKSGKQSESIASRTSKRAIVGVGKAERVAAKKADEVEIEESGNSSRQQTRATEGKSTSASPRGGMALVVSQEEAKAAADTAAAALSLLLLPSSSSDDGAARSKGKKAKIAHRQQQTRAKKCQNDRPKKQKRRERERERSQRRLASASTPTLSLPLLFFFPLAFFCHHCRAPISSIFFPNFDPALSPNDINDINHSIKTQKAHRNRSKHPQMRLRNFDRKRRRFTRKPALAEEKDSKASRAFRFSQVSPRLPVPMRCLNGHYIDQTSHRWSCADIFYPLKAKSRRFQDAKATNSTRRPHANNRRWRPFFSSVPVVFFIFLANKQKAARLLDTAIACFGLEFR